MTKNFKDQASYKVIECVYQNSKELNNKTIAVARNERKRNKTYIL
jgi:hypothetical protein